MHDLTPKRDRTRDQQEVDLKEASSEMKGSTTSVLENRCVRQRILEKIPNSMSFSASLSENRVNRLQGREVKVKTWKTQDTRKEFHQETEQKQEFR